MRIAVNTRFVIKDKMEGIGWFSWEAASRMAAQQTQHQFVFLFDRKPDPSFTAMDNVESRVLMPPARRPFLWKLWFEYAVPRALKQLKPDAFISLDGFCSLKTDLPTYMVVHDLAFEHFEDHVPVSVQKYYKKYSPKYAARANRIGTVSQATSLDMQNLYATPEHKIDVLHNGAGAHFKPLDAARAKAVQQQWTSSERPYFLYVGSLNPRKNLIRLLHAFDAYCKEAPDGCNLVLAGRMAWNSGPLKETFESIQHKDRVITTGHISGTELAELTGAALAMVYPSLFEGFGIPVLEAMQCDVPVITSNCSSMPEVAGDAALLIDPLKEEDITAALQKMAADASFRTKLIEKGRIQRQRFSWDQTAERLWAGVTKMLQE